MKYALKTLVLLTFLSASFAFSNLYANAQVLPATCDALVTDIPMWGLNSMGVDLRAYTNSTLHWIGCPTNGCNPDQFFCNFDPNTETLSFGTTVTSALRAAVDPGNARGNDMPTAGNFSGCCSQINSFSICNSPDSNNNGIPINMADALCAALGYLSGSVVDVNSNSCPEANTLNTEGTDWSSDFVGSSGFGQSYTCVGFRLERAIGLAPLTATNQLFTEHTVTATVLRDGIPEEGILVDFEVTSGPNQGEQSDPGSGECTPNDDCTTDASGQVLWTYSGGQFVGTDTIVASFINPDNQEEVESNTVEKTWVIVRNVPTLSEWGLIAMAGVLGIIGLLALRRRKAVA